MRWWKSRKVEKSVDYSIKCICDAWMGVDGPWLVTVIEGGSPRRGYEKKCEFHERFPHVFFDRDQWFMMNKKK